MFQEIMRACYFLIWIFLKKMMASGEVQFLRAVQKDNVNICQLQPEHETTEFSLYRKTANSAQNQKLLSGTRSEVLLPEYEGRIKISKKTSLNRINVTLLDLRKSDTGVYICEFRTKEKLSPEHTQVIVLVKGEECLCHRYSLLIYIISSGVILCLLTVFSLSAAHYRKRRAHAEPQPAALIYEPMSPAARTGTPPVYTTVQKTHPAECHYEVPA